MSKKVCCWLQSRLTLKKRTALGGKGGVFSKGKNERVIHVYEPQERCKDRALWESFREGKLAAGGSLQADECLPVTQEASNPPDEARWNSFSCHFGQDGFSTDSVVSSGEVCKGESCA